MEAVGARLGRSSNRYGTNTTVFTGPVRKWKKGWIPINPSSSSSTSNSNDQNHVPSSSSYSSSAIPNGDNINESVSHLRFFKWAPISQITDNQNSNINNNGDITAINDTPTKEDSLSDELPRREFKYIPIAVLEEQKKEAEENTDDDTKPAEEDEETAEEASKRDAYDEKPDINDVPMEVENQDTEEENQAAQGRQDLNQSLDLSLGFTSHETDNVTNPNVGEPE